MLTLRRIGGLPALFDPYRGVYSSEWKFHLRPTSSCGFRRGNTPTPMCQDQEECSGPRQDEQLQSSEASSLSLSHKKHRAENATEPPSSYSPSQMHQESAYLAIGNPSFYFL